MRSLNAPRSFDAAQPILRLIDSVDWGALEHAYGPADDVAGQLAAVTVGDDATRRAAWSNLWGSIHHQGTVYSATAPAVSILQGLALWREYPDRDQALAFLTEIARAAQIGPVPGSRAGVYSDDPDLPVALAAAVEGATIELMSNWAEEDAAIRRFLLLLVAVQPACRVRYQALVEPELPERHRQAWIDYAGRPESDDADERLEALEQWAHGAGPDI